MILKKIDGVGRIVIPAEIRSALGWREKDSLSLELGDRELIIRKPAPTCSLCGSEEHLTKTRHGFICEECRKELAESKTENK